ncbi:MAG TPA: GNAT family N-acetyltransferase [Ferruginibacter sp.]|nr:GNAT family N-acetyltransferase [Ferruginibacter sp.]
MHISGSVQQSEYPILLKIWESSVKATHHFLRDGDVEIFKNFIQEKEVFGQVTLACARDDKNDITGFLGVAGNSLEMLFIDAAYRGRGIGKMLLLHAINNLHITKVDVNEQNEQAIIFYERHGFKTMSRSEKDGMGKPYPILHMELVYDNAGL